MGVILDLAVQGAQMLLVLLLAPLLTGLTRKVKARILSRRAWSKVSNMPAGMLQTLQETQILDLLAYLISDGDAGHAAAAGQWQSLLR